MFKTLYCRAQGILDNYISLLIIDLYLYAYVRIRMAHRIRIHGFLIP